jgi:penicillin-insensitive murein endopeptidase
MRVMAVVLLCVPVVHAAVEGIPDRFRKFPFSVMSLTVGSPDHGFQVRAKKLRNAPDLLVRPSSDGRNYGHPALVLMLGRSAHQIAKAVKGSRMLVGDLSRENGGHLDGHHSHQSGRDADIGFYVKDDRGRPVNTAPRFVRFDGEGRSLDGSPYTFDDYRNWLLVQAWVRDDRAGLSHIFVSTPLRNRLLRFGQANPEFRKYVDAATKLLKQPERAEVHDDHFHVRIDCPMEQAGLCVQESARRARRKGGKGKASQTPEEASAADEDQAATQ